MIMKEILIRTVWVYGFIFIFSLALSAFVQFRRPKAERSSNIWIRTFSWLIIFFLFLSCGWKNLSLAVFVSVIAFLGTKEYFQIVGLWNMRAYRVAWFISNCLLSAAIIFKNLELFYLVPVFVILYNSLLPITRQSYVKAVFNTSTGVWGLLYWGWCFSHFALLRDLEGGFGYIILLGSLIAANDNTAYAVGKIFGKEKRKLSLNISLGKTVIGALGGFLSGFLIILIFRYTALNMNYAQLIILAFITGIAAPIGDLVESAIKRDMEIKDSGKIVLGHGGILDRFDSWTFVIPIAYYYIRFITKV